MSQKEAAPALVATTIPPLEITVDKAALDIKQTVLTELAKVTSINTPQEAEEVGELLKALKGLLDYVEESRKKIKKPFDDACKKIQSTVKEFTAEIENEDNRMRNLLAEYVSKQQEKQVEEVRSQGEVISSTSTGAGITTADVHKYEITDLKKAYEASPGLFDIVPRHAEIMAAIKSGAEIPFIKSWTEKSVRVSNK